MVDQPGKGALHHPTLGSHSEAAAGDRWMGDDQLPAEAGQQPGRQGLTEIRPVGPQQAQAAQERAPVLQQPAQPGLVLHVGRGDQHCPQQAERIHQHVALAAFDVLAAIEAAGPPSRRWGPIGCPHCRRSARAGARRPPATDGGGDHAARPRCRPAASGGSSRRPCSNAGTRRAAPATGSRSTARTECR